MSPPIDRVRGYGLAACIAALALTGSAFAQDAPAPAPVPAAQPAYENAIAQAVAEFGAGRWEEARALFKRAHQIEPNARTLRGMGMTAFELRMYVVALRELEAAVQDTRKPLTEAQRRSAQALIERTNAFVGRHQLVLEPAHAKPYVDGQPVQFEPGAVVLLDIGEHELRVVADGYRTATRRLRVEGGQRAVLRVTLEANTPVPSPRTLGTRTCPDGLKLPPRTQFT